MSSEIKNPLVRSLMEKISKEKSSLAKFADATGLPRDRVYKWIQQGTNPKSADEKVIEAYLRGETYMDKNPTSSTEHSSLPGTMTIKVEGNTEKTLFEALLSEKEARRQEAEARLKKEEDRYDKLFILLESNLKELYDRTLDIITAQHVGAAYQMFWIDRWAEKEAGGDKEKAERLVKAYRTAVVDKLKGKKEKSTP